MFLRFDPVIEGGSTDAKFAKQIVVESFSWGETNDGKEAVAQDFNFVAVTDKQSPRLLQACAEGTPFNAAELSLVEPQQGVVYSIKLTGVSISSYQVGGHAAAGPTLDQASLRFSRIDNVFRVQNPDGTLGTSITGGFDFSK